MPRPSDACQVCQDFMPNIKQTFASQSFELFVIYYPRNCFSLVFEQYSIILIKVEALTESANNNLGLYSANSVCKHEIIVDGILSETISMLRNVQYPEELCTQRFGKQWKLFLFCISKTIFLQ